MHKPKNHKSTKNYGINTSIKIVMTGGHHTCALPIINELKSKSTEIELFWFGHKHSLKGDKNETLEYKDITKRGIPFFELHAGKIYKTYDIARLLKVPFGVFQAFYLLLKLRPNLIFSFGGYLAAPVVFAGFFLGIPIVTHEQTVVAGYANKFVSLFAKKIFISWKESSKYFPKAKVVETGLPLREEIFNIQTNNFVFDNNFPVVYIAAGKTGSHKINLLIFDALKELLTFCNIVHQTGDHSELKDFERLSAKYSRLKNRFKTEDIDETRVGRYFPKRFVYENEIGEVFNKSALIVSRAGAHISAEILALKKPALLIPIPWVSHNEQYENALVVKNAGLAEIIEEKDLTKETLINSIREMLNSLSTYKVKKGTYLPFTEDSAKTICNEILSIASKN